MWCLKARSLLLSPFMVSIVPHQLGDVMGCLWVWG